MDLKVKTTNLIDGFFDKELVKDIITLVVNTKNKNAVYLNQSNMTIQTLNELVDGIFQEINKLMIESQGKR